MTIEHRRIIAAFTGQPPSTVRGGYSHLIDLTDDIHKRTGLEIVSRQSFIQVLEGQKEIYTIGFGPNFNRENALVEAICYAINYSAK